MPLPNGKAIMTAYKLCKVEFHYWGMQSKIEKFIHDVGKCLVQIQNGIFVRQFSMGKLNFHELLHARFIFSTNGINALNFWDRFFC